VQDTFVRAYEKAGTYKPDGEVDGVLGRQRVRAWLGRISENIVHDYYRHEPQITFMDEGELPPEDPVDPTRDTGGSEKLRRLEDALAQLSEREQEVLRATAMWYKPGERQQRLPNSEMKKLAASWNTSSDNIRQIRGRALAKLRASMET
jgi:RNA polymerase sigma factor (sigma-70 family)